MNDDVRKYLSLGACITIINIDGPKLVIEPRSYSIFIWTRYRDGKADWKGDIIHSEWIVFRNLERNVFEAFLSGKISFYTLCKEYKWEPAFLRQNLDMFVFDPDFRIPSPHMEKDDYLEEEGLKCMAQWLRGDCKYPDFCNQGEKVYGLSGDA